LQLTRQDDGTFGAWTALTPWRYLGKGVVFESGQNNDTFFSSSGSVNLPQPLPTTFPLPFQGQQILTSTTAYQCYLPPFRPSRWRPPRFQGPLPRADTILGHRKIRANRPADRLACHNYALWIAHTLAHNFFS
jgi:hypothetical protein